VTFLDKDVSRRHLINTGAAIARYTVLNWINQFGLHPGFATRLQKTIKESFLGLTNKAAL